MFFAWSAPADHEDLVPGHAGVPGKSGRRDERRRGVAEVPRTRGVGPCDADEDLRHDRGSKEGGHLNHSRRQRRSSLSEARLELDYHGRQILTNLLWPRTVMRRRPRECGDPWWRGRSVVRVRLHGTGWRAPIWPPGSSVGTAESSRRSSWTVASTVGPRSPGAREAHTVPIGPASVRPPCRRRNLLRPPGASRNSWPTFQRYTTSRTYLPRPRTRTSNRGPWRSFSVP